MSHNLVEVVKNSGQVVRDDVFWILPSVLGVPFRCLYTTVKVEVACSIQHLQEELEFVEFATLNIKLHFHIHHCYGVFAEAGSPLQLSSRAGW